MEVTGHAATGAAGGAMLGLVPGLIDSNATLVFVVLGCAGTALLPDWDHPKATAARTFGFASRLLAHAIEKLSEWVYISTKTRRDARRQGGHRTLTHTFLFSIVMGILSFMGAFDRVVGLAILFVALCLGIRGFLPNTMNNARRKLFPRFFRKIFPKSSAKVFLYLVAAMVPLFMYAGQLPMLTPLQLALVVGWGSAVHSLGDCLTNSGAPLAYPLPIQRQLWYRFKAPARFNTGSELGKMIERWIKRVCFLFIVFVFFLRWYIA